MIAASATPRMPTAHRSKSHARRPVPPATRPEPAALAWARLVLRPEVLPRAILGQALLARRLTAG
jgi:hypothetical protein